jgi:hypothetical protein
MSFNRRIFMTLLLASPKQKVPAPSVAVLETFTIGEKAVAVLVNHANEETRNAFAEWLRAHHSAQIRIRNQAGEEANAVIFRVRMCFGRGLVILERPLQVREREALTII